jgi:hypothetical protein
MAWDEDEACGLAERPRWKWSVLACRRSVVEYAYPPPEPFVGEAISGSSRERKAGPGVMSGDAALGGGKPLPKPVCDDRPYAELDATPLDVNPGTGEGEVLDAGGSGEAARRLGGGERLLCADVCGILPSPSDVRPRRRADALR